MADLIIGTGALRGVSAVLAEYVTAKAFAAAGDDVVWTGGGGKMYDIATHPVYTDVKKLTLMKPSEQRRHPGYVWQLRRPEGGAFATHTPAGEPRRTHLALIRCDPEPTFKIRDTPAGATIEITFTSIRISYIQTETVNHWMADVTDAFAYLPEAGLDADHYAEIGPNGIIRWPSGQS